MNTIFEPPTKRTTAQDTPPHDRTVPTEAYVVIQGDAEPINGIALITIPDMAQFGVTIFNGPDAAPSINDCDTPQAIMALTVPISKAVATCKVLSGMFPDLLFMQCIRGDADVLVFSEGGVSIGRMEKPLFQTG